MPSSPQDLVRRLAAAGRAGAQTFRGEERSSTPPGPTPKASPVAAPTTTAADATTRAIAPTRSPEIDVRVAAATSPRLAELLAPEWDQTTLDRRTWRTDLAQAEMVLLESAGGEVVGWLGADAELTGVVEKAVAQGIPVLVWLTAGPVPDTGWLRAATAVGAVTGSLRDQAATMLGRDVALWHPFGQPRLSGLDSDTPTTTRRTTGALVVVDGLSDVGDPAVLDEVIAPALSKLPARQTPVARVAGKSSTTTLPPLLGERQVEYGSWDSVRARIPDAAVLLDLTGSCPAAVWTTLHAATSRTPVVGTDGLLPRREDDRLPAELETLITRRDDQRELRSELIARIEQAELRDRDGLRLQRAVLHGHSAADRVDALLAAAGRPAPHRDRSVSAIVPTNRTHELDNVLANVGRQSHDALELVLVLHGVEPDENDLRARAADQGIERLEIVRADPSLTLGACMNLGVDRSAGRYVAKMDDDNFYGEHYLADLLDCFRYTDAGIVGKWAHYVWLRSSGAVVLRYFDSENRYERRVQGGSMLFEGDVVRSVRFSDIPRAVDSDILDRSMAEGVKVYSGDRYNYVSIRGSDRHAHTWTVSDATFMTATGRLLFHGDPRDHVSI